MQSFSPLDAGWTNPMHRIGQKGKYFLTQRTLYIVFVGIVVFFFNYSGIAQNQGKEKVPDAPTLPAPKCDSYSMQTISRQSFGMKQRTCYWGEQLFTGSALFGAAFFGAIAQARDDPPEWPQGADGFGRRMGTRYTQGMIKSTATFVVSSLTREDPRVKPPQIYSVSDLADTSAANRFGCPPSTTFKGRLGQSLLRVVWDSCRTNPWARPKPARVAGSFASGFLGLAWAPASQDHISNALIDSGTAFGGYIGDSVFSEFSPDISRMLGHLFPLGKPKFGTTTNPTK